MINNTYPFFKTFLIATLLLSFSCSTPNNNAKKEMIINLNNLLITQTETIKYNHQIEAYFQILYFGSKENNITIDNYNPLSQRQIEEYIMKTQKFSHYNILYYLRKTLPKPEKNDLSFNLDTTFTYPIVLNRPINNPYGARVQDTVLAYPLIIENISNSFVAATYDNFVPLSTEAKTKEGQWQSITYPVQIFCGTGIYSHPVFPNEILITSIPVFEGSMKTKIRFKIQDSLSKEFSVNLDDNIFASPPSM